MNDLEPARALRSKHLDIGIGSTGARTASVAWSPTPGCWLTSS